ncbi:hypothetical protein RintRC_7557 [Richelia intracellularis]|nr:hypothetical protein RintRC_7605 [Richelia intracellularis]CDN13961.1 hypothetical protein RintRC_7557 [Richelia intracellularis]
MYLKLKCGMWAITLVAKMKRPARLCSVAIASGVGTNSAQI